MKYAIGDWLGVRMPGDTFLTVYVAGIRGPEYDLALTDYWWAEAPGEGAADDCLLLAVEMVMEDSSFSGLEVVVMGQEYVDGSKDIWLIKQDVLPDYMGLSGLERMMDTAALGGYLEKELALRTAGDSGAGVRKYLLSTGAIFAGAPLPNPFPLVKLYRIDDGVVFCWQIYGSPEPPQLVVSEGRQGEMEEHVIGDKPIEVLEEEYARLIDDKKWEGYQALYLLLPGEGEGG